MLETALMSRNIVETIQKAVEMLAVFSNLLAKRPGEYRMTVDAEWSACANQFEIRLYTWNADGDIVWSDRYKWDYDGNADRVENGKIKLFDKIHEWEVQYGLLDK